MNRLTVGRVVLAAGSSRKVVWPWVSGSERALVDVDALEIELHHGDGNVTRNFDMSPLGVARVDVGDRSCRKKSG